MSEAMRLWTFSALDSLFFREAKPFNAGEGGFLDSVFPPPAQTLAGAIRGAIGEAMGVDWRRLHAGGEPEVAEMIGASADDPGRLAFAGPYLLRRGQRLYPAPLHLLYSAEADEWSRLRPAARERMTDGGMRRLPEPERALPGAKPPEHAWLDEANMRRVLQGGAPASLIRRSDLFSAEPRTGIGRDNRTRTAREGMLYFTRHVRLKDGVALAMGVSGAQGVAPPPLLKLGGEGRMAAVRVTDAPAPAFSGESVSGERAGSRAMLVLLTHGDFGGRAEPEWPEGVRLVSACIGRAVREGGWDYARRAPKPLRSLVPAGSVYFLEGEGLAALEKRTHIGGRTRFGYGEFALGTWED